MLLLSTLKQASKLINSSAGRDLPEQKVQRVKVPKLQGLSRTEVFILLMKNTVQTCTLKYERNGKVSSFL